MGGCTRQAQSSGVLTLGGVGYQESKLKCVNLLPPELTAHHLALWI